MAEINWSLLQPVDTGAQVQQGFNTGMAMVKQVQRNGALSSYLANPDDPTAYNALAYYDPASAATIQNQRLQQRKVMLDQQDRQRAVSLGELATHDPAGARQEAVAAGDFDLADHFAKLDDDQRKRTAEVWGEVGPVAFKLKQIKNPQERMAYWQQARPILEAKGADPATLDKVDPTNDTQLDAAITTAQKMSDVIEQARATYHQVPGDGGSLFATDFMGHPIGTQNPYRQNGATAPGADTVATTLSASLPPAVVAGFLGNFHVEGGYGGGKGDGGTAAGIGQWRGERQANFERIIGKPVAQASPDEQAKFVLWEMQNPEAAGMTVEQRDLILNAKTPAEAADLIDRFYERSSGEHRQQRVIAANGIAGVPVRVASKAEYDHLPSGSSYIAPDGSHRRKP